MNRSRFGAVWRSLAQLGWGVIAPVVSFYLLRAFGIDALLALLVGAATTVLGLTVRLIRTRRLDGLSAMFGVLTLLGLGLSLVDGSPRFLLAKDGILTAAAGTWFLLSLRGSARPAGERFARLLMEPMLRPVHGWDRLWDREPVFRRAWRVGTAIWGAAMLADAVVRIATAYLLPIDAVPGFNAALWAALFVGLQVVTNVYYARAGLFRLIFHPVPETSTSGSRI